MSTYDSKQFEEATILSYIEGQMSAAQATEFERRAATDPSLFGSLQRMRDDRDRLRSLAAPEAPGSMIDDVLNRIERSMLLAENPIDLLQTHLPSRRRTWHWQRYAAAAAFFLLASGAGLMVVRTLLVGKGETYAHSEDLAHQPAEHGSIPKASEHQPINPPATGADRRQPTPRAGQSDAAPNQPLALHTTAALADAAHHDEQHHAPGSVSSRTAPEIASSSSAHSDDAMRQSMGAQNDRSSDEAIDQSVESSIDAGSILPLDLATAKPVDAVALLSIRAERSGAHLIVNWSPALATARAAASANRNNSGFAAPGAAWTAVLQEAKASAPEPGQSVDDYSGKGAPLPGNLSAGQDGATMVFPSSLSVIESINPLVPDKAVDEKLQTHFQRHGYAITLVGNPTQILAVLRGGGAGSDLLRFHWVRSDAGVHLVEQAAPNQPVNADWLHIMDWWSDPQAYYAKAVAAAKARTDEPTVTVPIRIIDRRPGR